jgi:hypothetical protein
MISSMVMKIKSELTTIWENCNSADSRRSFAVTGSGGEDKNSSFNKLICEMKTNQEIVQ